MAEEKMYTEVLIQENEAPHYIRDAEATHEEDIVYIIDKMIAIVDDDL